MRYRFNPCKFGKYLICSIVTFLVPIILSLFFTGISVLEQNIVFVEGFRIRVFDQILHSVLSLSILVLFSHLFLGGKTHANLSKGWDQILGISAGICLLTMITLGVIACFYAANKYVAFFLAHYKCVGAIELLSAAACVIVQCMNHREVFMVAGA